MKKLFKQRYREAGRDFNESTWQSKEIGVSSAGADALVRLYLHWSSQSAKMSGEVLGGYIIALVANVNSARTEDGAVQTWISL